MPATLAYVVTIIGDTRLFDQPEEGGGVLVEVEVEGDTVFARLTDVFT